MTMMMLDMLKEFDDYTKQWQWKEGETVMSSWHWPVFGCALYVFGMLSIQKYMKDKQAWDLQTFSIIHNVIMIILSIVVWVAILFSAYEVALRDGVIGLICEKSENTLRGRLGFWIYVYYLSKMYEFVDTLIIVLKKRNLIFLHIFHHAMMLPGTWLWLHDQWVVGSWWCANVNSFIHACMYYYYLRTSLGHKLWWKEYVTKMQLVQFYSGFVAVNMWLLMVWKPEISGYTCQHKGWSAAAISHFGNISFIVLFSLFFKKTYTVKQSSPSEKSVKQA